MTKDESLREKIIKELRNIEFYPSADNVVQEKGLLFRINPRYAKEKSDSILQIVYEYLMEKVRELRNSQEWAIDSDDSIYGRAMLDIKELLQKELRRETRAKFL